MLGTETLEATIVNPTFKAKVSLNDWELDYTPISKWETWNTRKQEKKNPQFSSHAGLEEGMEIEDPSQFMRMDHSRCILIYFNHN